MTRYYALVGCGASKREEPTEARHLYTSNYFQKKREFADEHCERWWILSAEHAALSPDKVVEPYDTVIDDVKPSSWARSVYLALRGGDGKWVSDDVDLIVLAGQDYIDPIRENVLAPLDESTTLGVTVRYPFSDTSGIGDQLAVLNDLIEDPASHQNDDSEQSSDEEIAESDEESDHESRGATTLDAFQ